MKKHTFDVHEQMENSLSDYQWESVPELNDHIEPAQNIDNPDSKSTACLISLIRITQKSVMSF